MSEKAKVILGIIIGVILAVAIFCLVVVICCAVNGLAFGEQICQWFGGNTNTVANSQGTINALSFMPII